MLGQDISQSGWPGCGEIDVMEHFGTGPATVHGTVHGPGYSGPGGISASRAVGPSLGRDFHVYSVAWDPGKIAWYVDDELYHAVTPADLNGNLWVFDHDFFLLINIAAGGTASVAPGKSVTFPQTMLIDYIRVYEPAARLA
jgi:beta-glucanase (GH16 family)